MNTLLDELKCRFPYQFERLAPDVEFFPGWCAALARACEQIDATLGDDKRGWHWTQIKEKFGVARLYYRFGWSKTPTLRLDIAARDSIASLHFLDAPDDSVAVHIHTIVSEAEACTASQCMVCGGLARSKLYEGWWATLCERHPPFKGKDSCWQLSEADE